MNRKDITKFSLEIVKSNVITIILALQKHASLNNGILARY